MKPANSPPHSFYILEIETTTEYAKIEFYLYPEPAVTVCLEHHDILHFWPNHIIFITCKFLNNLQPINIVCRVNVWYPISNKSTFTSALRAMSSFPSFCGQKSRNWAHVVLSTSLIAFIRLFEFSSAVCVLSFNFTINISAAFTTSMNWFT